MEQPKHLDRCKVFQIEEVLPHVDFTSYRYANGAPKRTRKSFDGKLVWMTSQRLQTFKKKGISCCSCGIEGKYFALEQHLNKNKSESPNAWHFNLYAIDEEGKEILMTRDHIIPKSLGGRNSLENSQTMCTNCNNEKGNKIELSNPPISN